MAEVEFDAVVLGAGPAGEICAGRLAENGLTVALVEQHLIGGECSYYACMPSKALLRPADLLGEARRVPGVAETIAADLNAEAVLERRDEVIHKLDDSSQLPWLQERGIELIRGEGRLAGERRVQTGERELRARRAVVIATGSAAAMPPIDGLQGIQVWNNRDATTAARVPDSMVVLGGGPVGVELAQAWASLGSAITVLEGDERLLPREEPFASAQVAAALRDRYRVRVRIGTRAERVGRAGEGVVIETSDGERIEAEEILIAVGRKARSAGLGLETAGVEAEEDGYLQTDAQLRVGGREWLYAVGDVNGRALLTHMGKYQAWAAAENILGRQTSVLAEELGAPRVTFTDPQVAAVGKTLAQAEEAGIDARAVDVDTDGTAGASFYGKGTGGTSRLVIDRSNETIVGATFSGFETAEILHAATVALVGKVPLPLLRHAVAAYPSRSELWLKLIEGYGL